MREDGDDVDKWYPFLAGAALRDFGKNFTRDPHIADWCIGLAEHFVAKGGRSWAIARSTAKALYEADPTDGHRLTQFSSVLRRTGMPSVAMAALKAAGERFRDRRDVIFEWGTVAGELTDYPLNVWLAARSLADGKQPLDAHRCALSLAGLGAAFFELHTDSGDLAFGKAHVCCGRLGLLLPELDPRTRSDFEKDIGRGPQFGIDNVHPRAAVDTIRRAVIRGANDVEPDNNPLSFERLIGDPETYHYTALLRFIGTSIDDK